jgi:uncharacterized protein YndB with AHSA1/START domain
MAVTTNSIELTVMIETSLSQCWRLLTEPQHLRAWFGSHIQLDARLFGRMEERWEQDGREMLTTGLIDTYEPPRLLSMTWADSDWPAQTRVTISLEERGTLTALTLTHTGWDDLPGLDRDALRQAHIAGWRSHLRSLSSYAASPRFG